MDWSSSPTMHTLRDESMPHEAVLHERGVLELVDHHVAVGLAVDRGYLGMELEEVDREDDEVVEVDRVEDAQSERRYSS